jgi:hypothetical protein
MVDFRLGGTSVYLPQPFFHLRQSVSAIRKIGDGADRFGSLKPANGTVITQRLRTRPCL